MSEATPVKLVASFISPYGYTDGIEIDRAREILFAAVKDREGLARALQEGDWRTALHRTDFDDLPDRDREWWLGMADAAVKWLTGEEP